MRLDAGEHALDVCRNRAVIRRAAGAVRGSTNRLVAKPGARASPAPRRGPSCPWSCDFVDQFTPDVPKRKTAARKAARLNKVIYLLHSTYTWSDGVIDFDSKMVQSDSMRIIFNGTTTIAILSDGSKGIAKLSPDDTYDQQKGVDISITKANIKSLQKQLKKLAK